MSHTVQCQFSCYENLWRTIVLWNSNVWYMYITVKMLLLLSLSLSPSLSALSLLSLSALSLRSLCALSALSLPSLSLCALAITKRHGAINTDMNGSGILHSSSVQLLSTQTWVNIKAPSAKPKLKHYLKGTCNSWQFFLSFLYAVQSDSTLQRDYIFPGKIPTTFECRSVCMQQDCWF